MMPRYPKWGTLIRTLKLELSGEVDCEIWLLARLIVAHPGAAGMLKAGEVRVARDLMAALASACSLCQLPSPSSCWWRSSGAPARAWSMTTAIGAAETWTSGCQMPSNKIAAGDTRWRRAMSAFPTAGCVFSFIKKCDHYLYRTRTSCDTVNPPSKKIEGEPVTFEL